MSFDGAGAGWDGSNRGSETPRGIVSPFDRPPVKRIIASSNTDLNGATRGVRTVFAPWCSWVFVEDDGEADLIILPGRAGGVPEIATIGRIVWIGDGACTIYYASKAPSRNVRLTGCNAQDAQVYAAAGAAASSVLATVAGSSSIYRYQFKGPNPPADLLSPINPPAGTIETNVFVEGLGAADVFVGPNVGDIALGNYILIPAGSNMVVTLPGAKPFEWSGNNPDIAVAQFLTP